MGTNAAYLLGQRKLEEGAEGTDVLQLQSHLLQLGCFDSVADRDAIQYIQQQIATNSTSRFGQSTAKAVRRFQRLIGLESAQAGCDLETQQAIRVFCTPPNVRLGCPNEVVVTAVQRKLIEGVLPGSPKFQQRANLLNTLKTNPFGTFGNLTLAALEEFQAEKSLSPRGAVGPTTFKIMFPSEKSGSADVSSSNEKTLDASGVLFPCDGPGWSHTSGSDFHRVGKGMHGADDTHALDLNKNKRINASGKLVGAYNDDKGKPVRAVAAGRVIETIGRYGWILIEHSQPLKLASGRIVAPWYTGMLHCDNLPAIGPVAAGQQVASIGTRNADNYHLHICLYEGNFQASKRLKSINIRREVPGFASRIQYWY
jgi:peptidoglycan hydrolase-like protein with peptidoglycan-binding domain